MTTSSASFLALHQACAPALASILDDDRFNNPSRSPKEAMEFALDRLRDTPEGLDLLLALNEATPGPQPDGSYITSEANAPWTGDGGAYRQLHAPHKQGVLFAAVVCLRESPMKICKYASRAEAMAERQEQRKNSSAAHAAYEMRLNLVAAQLKSSGVRWYSGVFGGVCLYADPALDQNEEDMPVVSARGALARAWGIQCVCGRRAGRHAEGRAVLPCEACERAVLFGTIADKFRDDTESEVITGVTYDRRKNIWLFADGALATHYQEWVTWGALALADAHKLNDELPRSLRRPVREWKP